MLNAIYFYYPARWLHKNNIPILPKFIEFIIFLIYNCKIPASSNIGKGSKFAFSGIGCIIHPEAVIGENCLIGANVIIEGRLSVIGAAHIGNNVTIGSSTKIVGPVQVGDNVTIESNSLVLQDIKKNSVVEGVPAKVIFIDEFNELNHVIAS